MLKEIMETVSSLDEKDDEESEEQKEEEWISYPCPPSNESNSSTHTLFNFPSCLPMDNCYDDCVEAFETLEKALITAPIVHPPDWNLPFEIMCDASDYAVGVVLG